VNSFSTPIERLVLLISVLVCCAAAWSYGGETFYIESRDSSGNVTGSSLYEEFGDWYAPGSTAKSKAPAYGLPGDVLQGQGSRFSFNTTINASYIMKIAGHADFVPGEDYNIYITTPYATSIDAANSTFVIYDDAHPVSSPLAAGIVPLEYTYCGNVWYKLAENITLGHGAALKVSEASPQEDRFYADAIMVQPYIFAGDTDISIGRYAVLDDTARWERWEATLPETSAAADAITSGGTLTFTVPEPGAAMKWRHSLRPAWLDTYRYLTLTYTASGFSTSPDFPFIKLCVSSDSWFTAVMAHYIIPDGTVHTLTVDLRPLTVQPQVIGMEIYLPANESSTASLTLEECTFRDKPPGFFFSPPSPPTVNTGFSLDTTSVPSWEAKPDWLSPGSAAENYSLITTGDSLLFSIEDSYKGMKWLNSSIGTHDTTTYPYIIMKYRCRNIRDGGTDYAIWLNGSGGEARPWYQVDLLDEGIWRWAFAPVGIPSVNQIAVQVQADASCDSILEIEELAFVDNDPRTDLTYFIPLELAWDALTSGTEIFEQVNLGDMFNTSTNQLLPRMDISATWYDTEKVSCNNLIPFKVTTDSLNLATTDLADVDSLEVPIGKRASEVYVFLGAYLPGRENPATESIISHVDETERFYVDVHYTDGFSERFFPVNVHSGQHLIPNNTFSVHAFPPDPARTIQDITLHDRSDGGLFALAAVTLNTSGETFYGEYFDIPEPIDSATAAIPPYRTPAISYIPPLLTVENAYARYVFDLSDGVSFNEWTSHFSAYDMLAKATDERIFSGTFDGAPFTSMDFSVFDADVISHDSTSTATLTLCLKGFEDVLQGVFSIKVDESPQVEFAIDLNNKGPTSCTLTLIFPDLAGLTLGHNLDNLFYTYPQQTFINNSTPINLRRYYSGYFPVQFMDIYDPIQGWGTYLQVKDLDLIRKEFLLSKGTDSASMGVLYSTLERVGLPAGERLETAPFVLGMHPGDWHSAMDAYRQWVATWYEPSSPRQDWFQEIYNCRRDYPIGGTWYLFNRTLDEYTFQNEIDNAAQYMGGADMIDISSWGWSATYGRIGEYRLYELGGLENFRSGIAHSQAQEIPVGLYIEGVAIDERSTIYQQHGEEWKRIRANGQEVRNGTEVWICSHVPAWQDYMKQLYSDVASETSAAAMYIDVFGMSTATCYSAHHGHPPGEIYLRGEAEMTRKIRDGLNSVRPDTILYTECTPVDVTSQYQDGSFSYTIWSGDKDISPTMTNFFRFCFPDFKQIEIVNGMFLARNWTEEGLKKAFMNGEGIWVKGDLAAWYDENTRYFYVKSHEIFRDHRDAFTCNEPDAFVETLKGNVYAHRFADGDKQIFTLYNANWRDVSGEIINAGIVQDVHIVDLWDEVMLDSVDAPSDYNISPRLFPRDIGCVGIFKRRIDVSYNDTVVFIQKLATGSEYKIVLTGVYRNERCTVRIPDDDQTLSINLLDVFHSLPDTLIVKLTKNDIVVDEYIINNLTLTNGKKPMAWMFY